MTFESHVQFLFKILFIFQKIFLILLSFMSHKQMEWNIFLVTLKINVFFIKIKLNFFITIIDLYIFGLIFVLIDDFRLMTTSNDFFAH